ncbi:MAG: helix-turn-helix transcriptional regulator, partial [Streptomyces sp.]|nr:helix-turn-helix transcriptional regulator [Streptomyces sp.]
EPHGRRPGNRRADGAPGPLSAAERRVAALAAAGHTNKEISQSLHITVSTVEQHLTRVFRKLRVGARRDLASVLGRDTDQQMAAVPAPPRPDRGRTIQTGVSGSGPAV